jgi:hypothetical protein
VFEELPDDEFGLAIVREQVPRSRKKEAGPDGGSDHAVRGCCFREEFAKCLLAEHDDQRWIEDGDASPEKIRAVVQMPSVEMGKRPENDRSLGPPEPLDDRCPQPPSQRLRSTAKIATELEIGPDRGPGSLHAIELGFPGFGPILPGLR